MNPRISVIIPAFNEEQLIGKCLKALKEQIYPKDLYEVIVVDGNSSDNTVKIALEYEVHVIKLNNTPTIGSTRQAGTGIAKGEIFAFVDSDIKVSKNWLSRVDKIFSDKNLLCVGGKILPDSESVLINILYEIYSCFIVLNQFLFKKNIFWGSNMAIRSNAFKEIEGFNQKLEMSEDWDLGKRLQIKFGSKSVKYNTNIVAKTSIRKQKNISVFTSYLLAGLSNYINFVFFNSNKTTKPSHIR